jgi:hypothetical protein
VSDFNPDVIRHSRMLDEIPECRPEYRPFHLDDDHRILRVQSRRFYGCARRGCDRVNPDWWSFGARGKSWCLDHRPLLTRLRMWLRERKGDVS